MKPTSNTTIPAIWSAHLFGTLEVYCPDGTRIAFDGKKAGELLAYLALHSSQPCEKSKIAALLWKESDPISARTRLRQEIPKLQGLLPVGNGKDETDEGSLLDVTRQTVQLRPPYYTTDVQQFQANLELASQASDPNTKLQLLTDAVNLYRADLLTEYTDWVLPLRTQYRAEYEKAAHEIAAIRQELEASTSAVEAEIPLPKLKNSPQASSPNLSDSPMPSSREPLSRHRFFGVVLTILALFVVGRYLWRPSASAVSPSQPIHAVGTSIPPLEYGQEKWVYTYSPQKGEQPNSEAKAIVVDKEGSLYVTGLVHTIKDDADILTVKLSPQGKQLWAERYTSPEHDCDRAFSIALSNNSKYIYVAGETFIPASGKVEESWRLVLICYDKEGKRCWVRRSPMTTKNHGHQIKVVACGEDGAIIAGTALLKEQEKIVVLSYSSDGTLRWKSEVVPKRAQNSVFNGLVSCDYDAIAVTGTALIGEGKKELDTDWMTARISTIDGKIYWIRTEDGDGHGSDSAANLGRHRMDTLHVGGMLSVSKTGNDGQYALGICKYAPNGMRLWRRETVFPKDNSVEYGGMRISGHDGITTAAVSRIVENQKTVPTIIQYDLQGVLRYKRDLQPPTEFPHLEVTYLWETDWQGGTFLYGISSNLPRTASRLSQIWVAHLASDGSIKRQFAYPYRSQGDSQLNAVYHQYVVGQVPLSFENRAFAVLSYPSP